MRGSFDGRLPADSKDIPTALPTKGLPDTLLLLIFFILILEIHSNSFLSLTYLYMGPFTKHPQTEHLLCKSCASPRQIEASGTSQKADILRSFSINLLYINTSEAGLYKVAVRNEYMNAPSAKICSFAPSSSRPRTYHYQTGRKLKNDFDGRPCTLRSSFATDSQS